MLRFREWNLIGLRKDIEQQIKGIQDKCETIKTEVWQFDSNE